MAELLLARHAELKEQPESVAVEAVRECLKDSKMRMAWQIENDQPKMAVLQRKHLMDNDK